jgi:DNA-binding LacI/PurR family transcriptional regulator
MPIPTSPARSQTWTCPAWRSIATCRASPRCARTIAAAASKSRGISSGSAIAASRCSPGAPRCCRVRSVLAGYRQAHAEAKLEVDPDLIRPQTQGSSIAFSDVCQLLQGPDRPTAIITLGTHMLAGVMDALASNGLRYPDDMSLVCIGDTDLARHATPGISALTWDLDQMGRVAANILLDRIRGGDEARKIRPVYLPTRFILRHSGAKPRAP